MSTTPKFAYVSKCCNFVASKQPCAKPKGEVQQVKGRGKKVAEFSSLGTWHCDKCRKSTKVSRHTLESALKAVQVSVEVPVTEEVS